jgi:hypothetical protein
MDDTPRLFERHAVALRDGQRVIRLFQLYARPLPAPAEVGHRLERQRPALVVVDVVREPTEERADVGRVVVFEVGVKILPLLRDPDADAEICFAVVYGNVDHAADEEVFFVDVTHVGREIDPALALLLRHAPEVVGPVEP